MLNPNDIGIEANTTNPILTFISGLINENTELKSKGLNLEHENKKYQLELEKLFLNKDQIKGTSNN